LQEVSKLTAIGFDAQRVTIFRDISVRYFRYILIIVGAHPREDVRYLTNNAFFPIAGSVYVYQASLEILLKIGNQVQKIVLNDRDAEDFFRLCDCNY